ncbi:hypothetical protein H2199_008967 [Coniosporium tulheliwenetii]|uniref:Uncharacterized protein n=1 Tax=Coniosporium tulheliwenetii TaxID=3383036 RepID=A0ACC2YH63_9PEZI|nr:hypothetical protein H2199_008967 [Cladosporium sp. JES 115]
MPESTPETPINCNVDFDSSNVAGKTAVVRGGANGLGEAYVRALHAAKANVFIGDMNQEDGGSSHQNCQGKPLTKFIKCDVTKWEDQSRLFQEVEAKAGKIHYVVANAGIASNDDVFSFDGPDSTPTEPRLNVIDVNMRGVLYTVKLAMHYFIKLNGKTPSPSQVDTCLILIGSGAAFLDVPRGPQYSGAKWGMRGVMHSLRRTAHFYGSRVNMLSPWYGTLTPFLTPHDPNWSRYVRTKILTEASFDHVENYGVQMATT